MGLGVGSLEEVGGGGGGGGIPESGGRPRCDCQSTMPIARIVSIVTSEPFARCFYSWNCPCIKGT